MLSYSFLIAFIVFILLLKTYQVFSAGVCVNNNSLGGKVTIVTGASSGIGYETAKEFARRKGKVILACKSMETGLKAAEDIIHETGHCDVIVHQLDLSSMQSVRQFASIINKTESRLDVLVNNAGVIPDPGLHITEDGLELQFATNHFGPFLLTNLLLKLLKKSAPSRIIVLSSVAHFLASLDMDNLNCEKYMRRPFWTYCSTKLANLLFVRELSKRLRGTGVTVNALHPGTVRTDIYYRSVTFAKWVNCLLYSLMHWFSKDCKSGAQTTIYLATADEVQNTSGQYFADCKPARISRLAADHNLAVMLWQKSETITGIC